MSKEPNQPNELEAEAKALRDKIYGSNLSVDRWDFIKHHWVADIRWLRRMAGVGLVLLLTAVAIAQQQPATSFGLVATFTFDPARMGGLSVNDYLSNTTLLVLQASNAATDPTNYTLLSAVSGTNFTQLSSTSLLWSNRYPAIDAVQFYVVQTTNSSGSASAFSPVAVWRPPLQGAVRVSK